MKFETQYLEEKSKNEKNIKELENILKELNAPEEEKIFNIHLNDRLENERTSLSFEYNGKKIEIERIAEKFSGEIMDGKNKIGIPNSIVKSLYDKCRKIFADAEVLDDERTFQ